MRYGDDIVALGGRGADGLRRIGLLEGVARSAGLRLSPRKGRVLAALAPGAPHWSVLGHSVCWTRSRGGWRMQPVEVGTSAGPLDALAQAGVRLHNQLWRRSLI